MPLKFYALSLLLVSSFAVLAQPSALTLKGQVLDATGKPIAYASISISSKGSGSICNHSGYFSLSIPSSLSNDTMQISMLGFETKKIPIATFISNPTPIRLVPKAVQLQEVVVKPPDPLELIRTAIARIPLNYFDQGHVLNGFYRVDTKKGDMHMMLSEAVFDVFNPPYAANDKSQFRLIKMRSIQDEQASHGIDLGLSPSSVYEYDIVRKHERSGLLSKEGLKDHKFKLRGFTDYHGTEAYLISFDQKDGLKKSGYKGELWLDAGSLAIIAIDMKLSPKGIGYAQYGNVAIRALMKLMGIQINIKKEEYLIRYKKYGNRWILSDVRNDHLLRLKSNRSWYDFDADIRVDYLVTGADTLHHSAFTGKEKLGNHKFIEFQENSNDTSFWKDYTTILPDYNIDAIVQQIKENNESFSLKNKIEKRLSKLPKDNAVRIDSILSYYHAQGSFSGMALVKKNGKVIFQKGYGLADSNASLPNTDTTRFRIGSLTKTFTSMLIRQLEQEGKLRLTDTIGRYFPGYIHASVTIEQLLTHTSGIPNFTTRDEHLAALMERRLPLETIIRQHCSDELEFSSGAGFRYSNSGYLILAGITEKVSGKLYEELLKEKIFRPLDMNNSGFGSAKLNSVGYWYDEPEPAYVVENLAGAGGIWSTAADLLKWDEALYGQQLLPQERIQESFVPRAVYSDWDADYGYGWMLDRKQFKQSREHAIVYHPGTDFGYYSMFVRQPDNQNLVIMLSNHGDFPRFDLTDLILNIIN